MLERESRLSFSSRFTFLQDIKSSLAKLQLFGLIINSLHGKINVRVDAELTGNRRLRPFQQLVV